MAGSRVPIPRAFFLVAACNFVFFLNFAFFLLIPLWVLERGGGEEIAGRVVGVQGFAGLIALPIIGYLLDRFGRRRILISGTLVSALCSLWFIYLESIGPTLYVVRAIQGIAFTCAFTAGQTLAVLFAPFERRAEAIGWFGISTVLTHSLSPLIGEEIILRWGFDAMFATGAVLGTLAFLLAVRMPRPPDFVMPADGVSYDAGLAKRAVFTATVAMLCYGFGFGATATFVPVLIERFDLGRVGIFFAAWSVAAVAVRLLFGSASDRLGRRAVLVPAMLTMSLAVAMLVFIRSAAGMAVIGVIFGIAQGLLYPTMNALVADWSSASNIGRTQSLFSGSYTLGISVCSFFFGTIAERHGYATMFSVTLAITLFGLMVFLAGPSRKPSADGGAETSEDAPAAA